MNVKNYTNRFKNLDQINPKYSYDNQGVNAYMQ